MQAPTQPARLLKLTAAMAAIAIPAFAAAPTAGAQDHNVDGVRARLHRGRWR